MYTLLIADDEFFTRKGLIKKIPVTSDGISKILEAEDGREGVTIAENTHIDIVLSDVRMPRMNGIAMCEKIRALYPDCVIIFLSGYSDKEYLRSAITLKAIQYVDKPIQDDELTATIEKAISCCDELNYSRRFLAQANQRKLARYLLAPSPKSEVLPLLLSENNLAYENFCASFSVVCQVFTQKEATDNMAYHEVLEYCIRVISQVLDKYHITYILTDYHDDNIVIHFLSTRNRAAASLRDTFLSQLLQEISSQLQEYPHFICCGTLSNRPEDLYTSFQSAVIGLQMNFYIGINSITNAQALTSLSYTLESEAFHSFQLSILNLDEKACYQFIDSLEQNLRSHTGTLVSNTKEIYYRILAWLIGYYSRKHNSSEMNTEQYLWRLIAASSTLDELCALMRNYVSQYFNSIATTQEHTLIASIKQVIEDHYASANLSIQLISDKLGLSSSYLCSEFKRGTSLTINYYIVDYRIQKAKELLSHSKIKINDISVKCGFTNQNYFAKTFKKYTGLSPSEFRDIQV